MALDPALTPELVDWLMLPGVPDGPMGLEEVVHRPEWMAFAACWGEPSAVFFPDQGSMGEAAKALCAGCSVRIECLDYAMANEDLEGIWGGTSSRERRRMRRNAAA